MIVGTGTDIVHIPRIQSVLDKFGARFEEKIFTASECALARSRPDSAATYAKRWAAKEAFFKALGTGFREGMSWHDSEIVLDTLGKPSLQVTGEALMKLLRLMPNAETVPVLHISLSDDTSYAQAFVIIEAQNKELRGQ